MWKSVGDEWEQAMDHVAGCGYALLWAKHHHVAGCMGVAMKFDLQLVVFVFDRVQFGERNGRQFQSEALHFRHVGLHLRIWSSQKAFSADDLDLPARVRRTSICFGPASSDS